jgi:hypothetical protein
VQQATPYISFGAVSNVLHCSMRAFWSPHAYILFIYLPWNVEYSLIRKHDFPDEFVDFIQFLYHESYLRLPYHLAKLPAPLATCKHTDTNVFVPFAPFASHVIQPVSNYWTADKDPVYPFHIFIRHFWTPCMSCTRHFRSPCTRQVSIVLQGNVGVLWYVVMKLLWTCVSDFVSINYSTHCAFTSGFMATDRMYIDQWFSNCMPRYPACPRCISEVRRFFTNRFVAKKRVANNTNCW